MCGRPGAKSATLAAKALTAAIRDPQTSIELRKPFASALALVNGRLPAEEASTHARKAAAALDALTTSNHHERAVVALAMAEVLTHLSPLEREKYAKRMAVDLGEALQDTKADFHELKSLADALTHVCIQLDPVEAEARLNRAEVLLVARFRKLKNVDWRSAVYTDILATLWLRLDRSGLARVTDTLCGALGHPDGQRYYLEFHVNLLKKVIARMDKRDLERLLDQPLTASKMQRALLDVLGESTNREFRNTWDYLDWKKLEEKRGVGSAPDVLSPAFCSREAPMAQSAPPPVSISLLNSVWMH